MLDTLLQNILNALQWGSFYALIALGYCLVYGVLLLINFAHGDIFMVGAYIAFFVSTFLLGKYTAMPGLPGWLVLAATVPATMLLTSGLGVFLERVAYRPLRRKGVNRLYVVITALMCGLILENGNLALLGASRKSFPELLDKAIWTFGAVSVTNLKILVIVSAFGVFWLLNTIVTKTKIGMAMRALSWDRFAVPLMGIPPDVIIVFTFILGSSMAALAGILFAMSYPVLDPYMGASIGWKAFIAAVVGGLGSLPGAVLGAFVLGITETFASAFVSSAFRDLFSFALMILIIVIRPGGLMGVVATEKA